LSAVGNLILLLIKLIGIQGVEFYHSSQVALQTFCSEFEVITNHSVRPLPGCVMTYEAMNAILTTKIKKIVGQCKFEFGSRTL